MSSQVKTAPARLPRIKGFDRNGEPELRSGENDALEIVFNFMPPQTASGEGREPELFETFEAVLSKALGVAVSRDDREMFVIAKPDADTAERAAAYLSSFWKEHAKPLKAALAAKPRSTDAPFATLKEFHAALVERLAAPLLKYGFKKAGKSKYRDSHAVHFRRKSLIGMQSLSISGGHLPPYLNPGVMLSVTHDLVERIYGPMSGRDEASWTETQTIGQTPLADDPSNATRVYRPSHLDAWLERVIPQIPQTIVPTLEHLSDPAHVERIFNDMPVDPPAYLKNFSDHEACRGLILARLLGRDDIAAIAAFHHKHLATLEFTTTYPAVEAYVMGTSRDEMIARAGLG